LRIYLETAHVGIPPPKSNRGRKPSKEQPLTESIRVDRYMSELAEKDWVDLKVRNTTKGKLKGSYHFRTVFIFDQTTKRMLRRLLVIRRTTTPRGELEYRYSFTNANLEQYTSKAIAYMQAQRYFVENCLKENKQILGMDKFQTRKWLAWHHQIGLNLLLSTFVLKEKLTAANNVPLLSARDIKRWIIFKLYKQIDENEMMLVLRTKYEVDQIFERHCRRQKDINYSYQKI
jgi:SRSO17 transposase